MNIFSHFAKAYMAMRECLVPDKTREAQEEIVADLHNCLEQLSDRVMDMESRIVTCTERMVVHAQASKSTSISNIQKIREKTKAKQYLQEKKRIQAEYDKTHKNMILIQQQIDNIVSSQLNMVVVDAMKQFNYNAARLSLPARTIELENLEEQLVDRTREVAGLQDAMQNISTTCTNTFASAISTNNSDNLSSLNDDDDELWKELDSYLNVSTVDKVQSNILPNNNLLVMTDTAAFDTPIVLNNTNTKNTPSFLEEELVNPAVLPQAPPATMPITSVVAEPLVSIL